MTTSYRYCGHEFTLDEIHEINHLIESSPQVNRYRLSFLVCQLLGWHRVDGKPKDMSCRVAMLRMHKDGLIRLPPPSKRTGNGRRTPTLTSLSQPGFPVEMPVSQLGDLDVVVVQKRKQSKIWNEHVERYHYLGYHPLPGAQIRYLIYSQYGLLSVLGFGSSAWKCEARDQWIGWSHDQRQERLHLIINNARFLILPWVKSRNLASTILSIIGKRIREDWMAHYGYHPALMETFVDNTRFTGTCYKAANWTYLGNTKGRGKLDRYGKCELPVKSIFVYPLKPRSRKILTQNDSLTE